MYVNKIQYCLLCFWENSTYMHRNIRLSALMASPPASLEFCLQELGQHKMIWLLISQWGVGLWWSLGVPSNPEYPVFHACSPQKVQITSQPAYSGVSAWQLLHYSEFIQKSRLQGLSTSGTAACFPHTGHRWRWLYRFFLYKALSVPTLKRKGLGTETPAHHHCMWHLQTTCRAMGGTVVATRITKKQLGRSSPPLWNQALEIFHFPPGKHQQTQHIQYVLYSE